MKILILNSIIVGIILVVTSLSNIAIAGLIENTDDDSFIDKSTGLEWMDFGINNHRSFNYVASQLSDGGDYYGWSLATMELVYEMWGNAFLGKGADETPNFFGSGQLYVETSSSTTSNVLTSVFSAMSYNVRIDEGGRSDYNVSMGYFIGINGLSYVEARQHQGSNYTKYWETDRAFLNDSTNNNGAKNMADELLSTLLVKKSVNVPEPSTLAIFAFGVIGLASRRYKNQSK